MPAQITGAAIASVCLARLRFRSALLGLRSRYRDEDFRATMRYMDSRATPRSTPRRKTEPKTAAHEHNHTEHAGSLLRAQGLKVTESRLLLLKALLDRHRPTTAQELLEDLAEHGLDQVTVYRTLTTLVEHQIAQPVSTIDGSRRFEVHACEGCRIDHPHLQCRRCGDLECLEAGVLPSPLIPTRLGGYVIDEAKLYLFGVCPKCQKLSKPKPKSGPEE